MGWSGIPAVRRWPAREHCAQHEPRERARRSTPPDGGGSGGRCVVSCPPGQSGEGEVDLPSPFGSSRSLCPRSVVALGRPLALPRALNAAVGGGATLNGLNLTLLVLLLFFLPCRPAGAVPGPAFPAPDEQARNLSVIKSWGFSIWDCTIEQRVRYAMTMYVDLGLIEEFRIPADKVRRGGPRARGGLQRARHRTLTSIPLRPHASRGRDGGRPTILPSYTGTCSEDIPGPIFSRV